MPVDKVQLDRAVRAALFGPEHRDVRFAEYRFNVKPAEVSRDGNGVIAVAGGDDRYISRRRRGRPNDRIFYEFEKRTDRQIRLEDIEIEIDRGGLRPSALLRPEYRETVVDVSRALRELYDDVRDAVSGRGDIDTSQQALVIHEQVLDQAFEESKRLLDGSWEGEATFLVVNIALNAR